MDIKLIAMDMDGTLFRDDHRTISPRTLTALREAADRGVHLVLASGRAKLMMEEAADVLGGVRYLVTASGAAVWDRETGERLEERAMGPETSLAFLRGLDGLDLPMEVYCEGRVYIARRHWLLPEQRPEEFWRLRRTFVTQVDSLPQALTGRRLEKVDLEGLDAEGREKVLRLAGDLGGLRASVSAHGAELCRADVDKGSALAALCARLGVAPGQVMAFGDGDNDRQMLDWAGWSFAMGNAVAPAKAAARYETADNESDGIALAVERYVLG